jgi:hypothetical protein
MIAEIMAVFMFQNTDKTENGRVRLRLTERPSSGSNLSVSTIKISQIGSSTSKMLASEDRFVKDSGR